MQEHASERMLRVDEVCEASGLTRVTIYRLEAKGLFLPRRRIGVDRVGWLHSELEEWLRSRPPVRQDRVMRQP